MRNFFKGRIAWVLGGLGWALIHAGHRVAGTETSSPVAQVWALAYEKGGRDMLAKVSRRQAQEATME